MFQLNLSAFGTQLCDRNPGSIVNNQSGTANDSNPLHHSVPIRICQSTCPQFLGIYIGFHGQHTVYQLFLGHLKAEYHAWYSPSHRHIIHHIQDKCRLAHGGTGSKKNQVRGLKP